MLTYLIKQYTLKCFGCIYQLTEKDIGLASENFGQFIIFDYEQDLGLPNSRPTYKIIEHKDFNIETVSMTMINNNLLLYVSNGKYVIVDVIRKQVKFSGKFSGEFRRKITH